MASSFELLPQNESAKPEAPSKVRWVTCGVLGAACLLVFAWHVRPGPPTRVRAELDEVQELIDDVIVLDRCDPNNPKTKGHFCKPGTGDIVEADPCDPKNPKVQDRGWWCHRGTSEVIISKDQKQAMANGARYVYPNTPGACDYQPVAMINQDYVYECVPCDPKNPKVAGSWCKPKTADLCGSQCDPCDVNNPTVGGRGWFCQRGTANVCVDEAGWAVLDPLAGKMTLGSATKTKACNKDALCKWGITGVVSFACAAAAGYEGGEEAAKYAFQACSNLAMKSIQAADDSDYNDKKSFAQKLFAHPAELLPIPDESEAEVLSEAWGTGSKTIGGALKLGLKSSKKFVLKNLKKEGEKVVKKWALSEVKDALGIDDDGADKSCGPPLRQLPKPGGN